jgi:hypothetical protein
MLVAAAYCQRDRPGGEFRGGHCAQSGAAVQCDHARCAAARLHRDGAGRPDGEKLHGGYALTRMRRRRGSPGWLLVKMRDEAAGHGSGPRCTRPGSVRAGRTVEEIAGQG